jgi:hypothetical protein
MPRGGKCRLRIPDEEFDAPVVACSELSSNEGASVTYTTEQRLAVLIRPARQHEGPTLSPREGGRQFLVDIQLTSSLGLARIGSLLFILAALLHDQIGS